MYARLGDWRSAAPLWEECRRQQPHNPAIELALQRAKVELDLPDEPVPVWGTDGVIQGGVSGGGGDAAGHDADDPAAGLGTDPALSVHAPPSVSGGGGHPVPPSGGPAGAPPSVSERKARSLKALAEEAFDRMHSGRALLLLGEALGLAPHLADVWSLRSRVYEGLHRYSDALADAQASPTHAPPTPRAAFPPGRTNPSPTFPLSPPPLVLEERRAR